MGSMLSIRPTTSCQGFNLAMAKSAYGRGDNPPEPGEIRPHRVMIFKFRAKMIHKTMYSEEFDEPDNKIDKRIFHVLSHGEKRQYEIARLAASSEANRDVIKDRIRQLAETYPWAEKVEMGTRTTTGSMSVDNQLFEKHLRTTKILRNYYQRSNFD